MPSTPPSYSTISVAEAERLVSQDAVRLLDVRTSGEYQGLGHIPGAHLLPVDLIAVAPATIPREGKPLLVYCEHGIRSAQAARMLAMAGFPQVLNMAGGMSCWRGERNHTPGDPCGPFGPAAWLVGNADLLPPGGSVLDVACGRGRHALLMASAGYDVRAIDRDDVKVATLRQDAASLSLRLDAETVDLEGSVDLGQETYDVILVFHYLHRPLFGALARALRRGGLLLYETFTTAQAATGHPKNPAYLLEPGELPRLVAPLDVERQREGHFEGRWIASVAARRGRSS